METKISGGFYRMSEPEGTSILIEHGMGTYLVLRFYDPMIITIGEEKIITEKDAFIIYTPGTKQDYKPVSGGFTNDYVSFIAERNYNKE